MKPPDLFASCFWLRVRLFRLSQWMRVYFGPRITPGELAKFLVWKAADIRQITEQPDNELALAGDELILMRMFTTDLALRVSIQAAKSKKHAENLKATQSAYFAALITFGDPHPVREEFLREEFLRAMHLRFRSYEEAFQKEDSSDFGSAVAAKLVSFVDGDSKDPDMPKVIRAIKEFNSIFDMARYAVTSVRFK
jgi:hypothetical protein